MKCVSIIWNCAMPLENEILNIIECNANITDTFKLDLGTSYNNFVRMIYEKDSIADWKVNEKIKHMDGFGTVVRILYTFQDLATQGNQSAAVAMGIGSALIATAFGLIVAIIAVIFFNSFQSVVKHYEDDFQLIKLLFLNYVDGGEQNAPAVSAASTSAVN